MTLPPRAKVAAMGRWSDGCSADGIGSASAASEDGVMLVQKMQVVFSTPIIPYYIQLTLKIYCFYLTLITKARKVSGWPNRCKLARAFLREHS